MLPEHKRMPQSLLPPICLTQRELALFPSLRHEWRLTFDTQDLTALLAPFQDVPHAIVGESLFSDETYILVSWTDFSNIHPRMHLIPDPDSDIFASNSLTMGVWKLTEQCWVITTGVSIVEYCAAFDIPFCQIWYDSVLGKLYASYAFLEAIQGTAKQTVRASTVRIRHFIDLGFQFAFADGVQTTLTS